MIKYSIVMLALVITVISCTPTNNNEIVLRKHLKTTSISQEVLKQAESEGYKLMKQKCFICHFKTLEPTRRDQMIAPPMLRVQEHYKPTYPDKDEFVAKVMAFINNPTKSQTLMPGAMRKFNLMPKLPYNQEELKLIAEALYDIDFGDSLGTRHRKGNHGAIELNDGKKWKLRSFHIDIVNAVKSQLDDINSENLTDYNKLGRDAFDKTKVLLLEESYSKEQFEQLHHFFGDVEENMHLLMAIDKLAEAKKQKDILIIKFSSFDDYFE